MSTFSVFRTIDVKTRNDMQEKINEFLHEYNASYPVVKVSHIDYNRNYDGVLYSVHIILEVTDEN